MSRDKGQAREKTQSTGNGTCSGFSLIYDRCDLPPSPALFRPFASSHQPATHLHRPASRPRHPGKAIHPTHHLSDSASALLPCVARPYLSTTTQYPSLPKQQLSYRSSLQPHRAPVWALCSEHQARLAGKPPRGRGVPSARPKFASRVCTVPPTDQIAVYWVPTPFSRPASCVSASEPEIGPVLGSSQRVRRLSRRLRMIGCCTLLPTRPQNTPPRSVVWRVAIHPFLSIGRDIAAVVIPQPVFCLPFRPARDSTDESLRFPRHRQRS